MLLIKYLLNDWKFTFVLSGKWPISEPSLIVGSDRDGSGCPVGKEGALGEEKKTRERRLRILKQTSYFSLFSLWSALTWLAESGSFEQHEKHFHTHSCARLIPIVTPSSVQSAYYAPRTTILTTAMMPYWTMGLNFILQFLCVSSFFLSSSLTWF